jgi:hypothetical protein
MKSIFSRMTGRLGAKSLLLLLPLGWMLVAPAVMGQQAQSTYINSGTIIYLGPGYVGNTPPGYPPNIDATNFVNSGMMEILAYPPPFMTSQTLNFTNTGEMLGEVGWEFDYGPLPGGGRGMAGNFYNGTYNPNTTPVQGLIESVSGALPNPLSSIFTYDQGYLWVSATNIVNKGMLAADAACEIKLAGTNVNLSRSYVEIAAITGVGSVNGKTNFSPDTAIYDKYWAQTNRDGLDSGAIWDGTTATLPPHAPFAVTEPCGLAGTAMLSFSPTLADSTTYAAGLLSLTVTNMDGSTTDVLVATNVIYQAAFVNITDPNITGTIGFTPSAIPTNYFQTVSVELQSTTAGNTLFLIDTLASDPGRGLLPNLVIDPAAACSGATYRPTNYIVERVDTGGIGVPGAGLPANNFFYQTTWSNRSVTAAYAAYSCFVDSQASEPPSQSGNPANNFSSVTNLSGRIHIYAGSLNLKNTQIRGEGEVVVQAGQLVSSQNASVDCENLSYNLGSTNGNLNVVNLALPSVVRFNGTVSECSAVWSNVTTVVTPNYIVGYDTNTPPNLTNAPAFLTNSVQINVYALLVDASQLSSTAPVTVYDLLLHSTNSVVTDSMSVIDIFLLDGQSFTLDGSLVFPGTAPTNPVSLTPFSANPIQNWVYTMAPTLRYFTNNGSLSIPNDAHFGDDGPTNYLEFINNGIITAGSQTIDSANLQVNGGVSESLVGDFSVTAGTAVFSSAQISAGGNININAGTVLIDPSSFSANSAINFNVTTNLSDGGIGAGNTFQCQNGFNLLVKPQTGDLWGSTFTTMTYGDEEADHLWAGVDRGQNPPGYYGSGYTNNVAINTLVLSPQFFSPPYYPLFYFAGTGVSNGLYVGTLDLTQLGSHISDMLELNPNLTIYYAHALVGFTPPGGATPENYLNRQEFPPGSGGHLAYAKDFTVLTAAAVSSSLKPKLSATFVKSQKQFNLAVSGTPGQSYIVQASTNLMNWTPIFTNSTAPNGLFQFLDSGSSNYRSRFYRVVSGP